MKRQAASDSLLAKDRAEYDDFLELLRADYSLLVASKTDCVSDHATLERDLVIAWDWSQGVNAKTLGQRFNLSPERIRDISKRLFRAAYRAYRKNGQTLESTTQFSCKCGIELSLSNASPTLLREKGWLILFSRQGDVYYACPPCADKIQKAAKLVAEYSDRFVDITPLTKT